MRYLNVRCQVSIASPLLRQSTECITTYSERPAFKCSNGNGARKELRTRRPTILARRPRSRKLSVSHWHNHRHTDARRNANEFVRALLKRRGPIACVTSGTLWTCSLKEAPYSTFFSTSFVITQRQCHGFVRVVCMSKYILFQVTLVRAYRLRNCCDVCNFTYVNRKTMLNTASCIYSRNFTEYRLSAHAYIDSWWKQRYRQW